MQLLAFLTPELLIVYIFLKKGSKMPTFQVYTMQFLHYIKMFCFF